MRYFSTISAALAAFIFGGELFAQQLQGIPSDAIAVIKVRNMGEVNQKIGNMMTQLGVVETQPILANPLVSIQALTGVQAGVALDGELAVAFRMVNSQTEPVLLVPVSDYEAFLGNFPDVSISEGIAVINNPLGSDLVYVADWDGHAAISPIQEMVSERPQWIQPSGPSGEQFAQSDLAVYVNFEAFRMQVQQGLGFGQMMLLSQFQQQLQANPDKRQFIPLARVAVTQLFTGLEHFITDTQAMTYGINLNEQGPQIVSMTDFIPDSYLGGLTSSWKTPEGALLAGLPDQSYAFVSGVRFDQALATQLVNDAIGPIIAEANKLGDAGKPIATYLQALQDFVTHTQSQTYGLTSNVDATDGSGLFGVTSIMQGDAQAIIQSHLAMLQSQDEFSKLMEVAADQPSQTTVIDRNAVTVEGLGFDRFTTVMGTDPNDPATQLLKTIYGDKGFTYLLGGIDENTVLSTTHEDSAMISQLLQAARTQRDVMADNAEAREVAGNLPANPFMLGYVFPGEFMEMFSGISRAITGSELQAEIVTNHPAGVAMSTQGTAIRFDMFLPMPLVEEIVKKSME